MLILTSVTHHSIISSELIVIYQVFEGHGRGIQTLAWCACDSGMLLTSSRDDHMICWNPNNTAVPGGEVSPVQFSFSNSLCQGVSKGQFPCQ